MRRTFHSIPRSSPMRPFGPSMAALGRIERFERALTLMQGGRWPEAFDALAALADEGHAQSARLALLFVQRGTRLFGGSFAASGMQREAWRHAGE